MANKIILDPNELYQKYKIEHLSQKQLAKYFHCSVDTIVRNLRDCNIISNTNSDYVNPPIMLTPVQKEVLYGALLGDGSLAKHKNSVNTCLSYGSKSRQHVEFVMHYFKQYITQSGIHQRFVFDARTNKTYTGFYFRTINNTAFEQERKHWYKNRKTIPLDLTLTPLVCLIWYIGDGCICRAQRTEYIKLATHCFSKCEQEQILLPQLSHFNAHLIKAGVSKDGHQQYAIKIPREKMRAFLEFIGPCSFEDYLYKWDARNYVYAPPTNHTDSEDAFCRLYLDGKSYYEIAKQFGVEPAAVRYYLIKRGIYKTPSKYKNAIVVVDRASGNSISCYLSMEQAAKQLGASSSYISLCANQKKRHPKYYFIQLARLDLMKQEEILMKFNMKGEKEDE
ncbi:MAG: hypothetical protein IJ419_09645 [Agathobacter sp.]|nr:hypothetical protein [Agathobacter sp.]